MQKSAHKAAEMMKVSVVYDDNHVCHPRQTQWQTCQLNKRIWGISPDRKGIPPLHFCHICMVWPSRVTDDILVDQSKL